ncbi:uncharacterized [Tachysurus ichikawai]
MGTNGNGKEIGWNKSESILAPGSQPPSQTPHKTVWRRDGDIWCRDLDMGSSLRRQMSEFEERESSEWQHRVLYERECGQTSALDIRVLLYIRHRFGFQDPTRPSGP